jgi:hypothetical protein
MHMLSRTSITLAAIGSVVALTATTTATAAPDARSGGRWSANRTLSSGASAPFQIARHKGTVYFADGGAGTINKINKRGRTVVVSRIADVAGLEFNGKTRATASGAGPGAVVTITRRHRRPVVAHVGQYEQNVNPDRNRTYGIVAGGNPTCTTQIEAATHGPATYTGVKDSHPYQLAALPHGAYAVAEAAGNSILRVGKRGAISTIAVLPPQLTTFTASQAGAVGAPACAGATYAFEPVPTDVERVGGALWVSTLPGGPEDPSLGARGSVYRIKNGRVTKQAGGFLGATNLAVVAGRVYVSEFFAGKITKLGKGGRYTRANIPGAVSVEATRNKLYIGTLGMGPSSPGKVIRIPR